MKSFICLAFAFSLQLVFAQDYTSYFTGNTTDLDTLAQGGICLMGGATEDDNAMIWFLERANEGDVLVLRASGSDGYNNYMYSGLGVTVNSVETIVFNNANATTDSYVLDKVAKAEAIWFAGGDQWDYVSYWRNTPLDSTINANIQNKNLVVGGTSAGMAIQGQAYFTAENGTITSTTALNDPYDPNLTVDTAAFLDHEILKSTITDTHYDNPDRKGRHLTFMARMLTDYGMYPKGIACEEYTAVCIDSSGMAKVYGGYPTYDDFAYFIRVNCAFEQGDYLPDTCQLGYPLSWNQNDQVITIYKVAGTSSGSNTFDLNDWLSGSGGEWEYWWVASGSFNSSTAPEPSCLTGISSNHPDQLKIYPTAANQEITISSGGQEAIRSIRIYNSNGQVMYEGNTSSQTPILIYVGQFKSGLYLVECVSDDKVYTSKFVKL